jgi:hypothetical protein
MSTSLFYLPGYVKTSTDKGAQDVTHNKQHAFMRALQHWERLLRDPWFGREVGVRLYYDDSLGQYVAKNGTRPWPAVIERLSRNPAFQLIEYACQMPQLCLENGMHRGLFGTFVRIHAACEGPLSGFARASSSSSSRPRMVCVIDLDNIYSADWFRRNRAFLDRKASAVLGFTGGFELNLQAYLPATEYPGGRGCPANLKFCLTSFKHALPAACWDGFPEAFASLLPAMRSVDAVRQQLFREKADHERFFEDFGYGFDEYVLNKFVHAHVPPGAIEIAVIHRNVDMSIKFFFEKLVGYMEWNGQRSVAMRQLAADRGLGDEEGLGVQAVIDDVKARQKDIKTFAQLEAFIVDRLRPHHALFSRMQIDARLLALIATFEARQMEGVPDSKRYMQSVYDSDRAMPGLLEWARGQRL